METPLGDLEPRDFPLVDEDRDLAEQFAVCRDPFGVGFAKTLWREDAKIVEGGIDQMPGLAAKVLLTSSDYEFDVDGVSDKHLGLLGRVFRDQQLECVDTPFLTDLKTQTSPIERSARFSLFSLREGRERSRRPSLSGRGLHFVAVGHFAHFGARFPVFGAVRPCASVRDRLTISYCFGFWRTSVSSPGRTYKGGRPLTILNHKAVLRTPGRTPICGGRPLNLLDPFDPWPAGHGRTPCLPSAIPKRFAGGLSCQGMTIRLIGCGLCQSEIQFKGNQCSFARGRGQIPISQIDQQNTSGMEAMMRQMQESMKLMQQDATRQEEFAKQQVAIMVQQVEVIIKLQQQSGASASQQVPPPAGAPAPGETPNVQGGTDIPVGPALPAILPQLSKTPTNLPDSPFEFEVDPTTLKLSKLEKLLKKSQGVKSIPGIEDGYTDAAVTLPDRFKMPHIDRFDGSGGPMVHLSLFSDVLRLMGLTRLQKLSLFGRTLSGIAVTWYAKLEHSVKRSWEEMAEAFVAQYSYNTQIEITTRDLETTRQEPKESFSEFVPRWRAKASMMTIRPTDKDQIRMIVRNLQPKLMQKMIMIPFPTFPDLHEMGVQIEDAMKQGLFDQEKEQPRRAFTHSSNATTSGDAAARSSEVGMVTATAPKTTTPFTSAFGSSSQVAKYPPQARKVFTPLYMLLSKALGVLIKKGHLKPLEPQPLPKNLPLSHNPANYCAFHQRASHDTDMCFRLRHEIQDLIDNGVIPAPGPAKSIGT
ncbi:hypothetical protein HYC85_028961 [Camellia sinensis]|uniref:Retrotransposon gag domain-containing protein n=1 Tax=Camellia sinensis TaxID=4442 RepID=A0A7J7FWK5_CAMSI|nr:hypothetical protein HYC85_028961 [Camellia sinensis]